MLLRLRGTLHRRRANPSGAGGRGAVSAARTCAGDGARLGLEFGFLLLVGRLALLGFGLVLLTVRCRVPAWSDRATAATTAATAARITADGTNSYAPTPATRTPQPPLSGATNRGRQARWTTLPAKLNALNRAIECMQVGLPS